MSNIDPILTNPDFLALPEDLDLLSRFRTLDTIPEEEAHRTIQKRSMDEGLRMTQTARKIIAELEAGE